MDRSAGYGEWAERAMAVLDTATPGSGRASSGWPRSPASIAGDLDGGPPAGGGRDRRRASPRARPRTCRSSPSASVELVEWESRRRPPEPWPRSRPGRSAEPGHATSSRRSNLQSVRGDVPGRSAATTRGAPDRPRRRSPQPGPLGNPSQLAISLGAYGMAARVRRSRRRARGVRGEPRRSLDQGEQRRAASASSLVLIADAAGPSAARTRPALVRHARVAAPLPRLRRPPEPRAAPSTIAAEMLGDRRPRRARGPVRGDRGGQRMAVPRRPGARTSRGRSSTGPGPGSIRRLLEAIRARAATGAPEDLAVEIIAELDALIAAGAPGRHDEERPAASP